MKHILAISLLVLAVARVDAAKEPPMISIDQEDFAAVNEYLDDAALRVKGRKFVSKAKRTYSLYGVDAVTAYGWRDEQGVIHFTDGSTSRSKEYKPVDFVVLCKKMLNPTAKEKKQNEGAFFRMGLTANPGAEGIVPPLAAIWLHRLGEKELAMRMWGKAVEMFEKQHRRDQEDDWEAFLETLGGYSPWTLFNNGVSAHMYDQGEDALFYMRRLNRLFPNKMMSYGDGKRLLADLERRKKQGTLVKKSPKKQPEGFDALSVEKRVSYLIAELDQVNARQWGQPGGVPLGTDWRVAALIRIGDPAMPALIDCFEQDDRLTKSVHYWRDFAKSRTVLSVREAALNAMMSILQVQLFEPGSTGSNFTSREDEKLKDMMKKLRDYWKRNGGIDREQRLMNMLVDDKKPVVQRMRALQTLAWADHDFLIASTVFSDSTRKHSEHKKHPLMDRFKSPSLAEAAVDLLEHRKKNQSHWEFCLSALAKIKDTRVNESLNKAYAANKQAHRKVWIAATLDSCGDSSLIRQFASGVQMGKIPYEPEELVDIINRMVAFRYSECEKLLMSFADMKHPHYKMVLKGLLDDENPFQKDDFDSDAKDIDWDGHRFAIKILVDQLANQALTRHWQQLDGEKCIRFWEDDGASGSSSSMHPLWVTQQQHTKDKVRLRKCDIAAERLEDIITDCPPYSPLLLEKDKALEKLRRTFAQTPIKEYPPAYARHLSEGGSTRYFALQVPQVTRWPATAQDLQQGRAIFHHRGKGKLIPLDLPAFANTVADEKEIYYPEPVVVIQAEKSPDGVEKYGCLTRYGIKTYLSGQIEIKEPRSVTK